MEVFNMLRMSRKAAVAGSALLLALPLLSACSQQDPYGKYGPAGRMAGNLLPGGRCAAYVAKGANNTQFVGSSMYQNQRNPQQSQTPGFPRDQRNLDRRGIGYSNAVGGAFMGIASVTDTAPGAAGSIVNSGIAGVDLPYMRVAVCDGADPTDMPVGFSPDGSNAIALCKGGKVSQVTVSANCVPGLASTIEVSGEPVKVEFSEKGEYAFVATRSGLVHVLAARRTVVPIARLGSVGATIYDKLEPPFEAKTFGGPNAGLGLDDMAVKGRYLYTIDQGGKVGIFDLMSVVDNVPAPGTMPPYGNQGMGLAGMVTPTGMGGTGKTRLAVADIGIIRSSAFGPESLFAGPMYEYGRDLASGLNGAVSTKKLFAGDNYLYSLEGSNLVTYNISALVTRTVVDANNVQMTDPDGQPLEELVAPGAGFGSGGRVYVGPQAFDMSWAPGGGFGMVVSGDRAHVLVVRGGRLLHNEFQFVGVTGAQGIALQPTVRVKVSVGQGQPADAASGGKAGNGFVAAP